MSLPSSSREQVPDASSPSRDGVPCISSPTSPSRTLSGAASRLGNFCKMHSSVSFWRKSTFDKPPPIWRKLPTVDSGLYDGAFPHVGGSISVKTDDLGFSFVLETRIRVRVLSLLNVDEHENTFESILEVSLEWEVEQTQFDVCREFWEKFRPLLNFENAVDSGESPEPIFDDRSEPVENGCLMLRDSRDGRQTILRHFEYRKRTQRKFRQPLDLVNFPFDVQTLPITFYSERTFMYGRPFHLKLSHPAARDDFDEGDVTDGAHIFEKDADCVDDMQTETLFALEGHETLPELREIPAPRSMESRLRPRIDQYTLLIFVSRQYKSTMYNIYIPLSFMFVLSFLAFFIPPCAVVDRASVSLTLLLTTVALKTYMSDKLPSVPYLSAAENFLFYITVSLLFQSIMMAIAASSCFRFGAEGQFGFNMKVLRSIDHVDDDEEAEWDCHTDENNLDFWCANRRARIQSLLDIISIWVSFAIGTWTVCKHIFLRLLQMYSILFEIHRHKFRSEFPELENHFAEKGKQQRKVESRLCFFAIRHIEDPESWGLIRLLFQLLEQPVFWRIHLLLSSRGSEKNVDSDCEPPDSPPSARSRRSVFAKQISSSATKGKATLSSWPGDATLLYDEVEGDGNNDLTHPGASDEWSTEEYAARRKDATHFFAKCFKQRALGYDNSQFHHGFRRPPWEKPKTATGMKPRLESLCRGSDHKEDDESMQRESKKVILFDCGTGETKPLLASLVDDFRQNQHRQLVVLKDKPGGSFAVDKQPIEMQDYCRKGDTASFIAWMENHVHPSFSFHVPHDKSGGGTPTSQQHGHGAQQQLDSIDLVEIFGFRPRKSVEAERLFGGSKRKKYVPLWEVGETITPLDTPRTSDGVKLLELGEGMALVSVNGAPYNEDAAKRCVLRAKQLGRGFRNPRQYDRVEAMCAIPFVLVVNDDDVSTSSARRTFKQRAGDVYALGDAIMTTTDGGIVPDGMVLPGQRGVIVREHRSNDEDAISVMYLIKWDDHPSLGETMVKQRKYRRGQPAEAWKEAAIKPVNEVILGCVCAAEPTEHEWREPVVVVGTGAWFRNSRDRVRRHAHDMFSEIQRRHPSWKLERNTEFDEAWFEDLSVRYIHGVYKRHPPDAVLAVGNGSTQFSSIVVPDVRDRIVFKKKNATTGEPVYGVVASRYWMRNKLTYKYKVFLEPPRLPTYHEEEYQPPTSSSKKATPLVLPSADSKSSSTTSLQQQPNNCPVRPHGVVTVKANQIIALLSPSSSGTDEQEVTTCKVPHLVQLGNRRGKSFFETGKYTRENLYQQLHERREHWYTNAKELMRELIRQDRICKGTPTYVTCISACYYAADFAGCRLHPNTTSAKDAREAYRRALEELMQRAATIVLSCGDDDDSYDRNSPVNLTDVFKAVCRSYAEEDERNGSTVYKSKIRGLRGGSAGSTVLSNLTYQIALIDTLFDDDTELRICRSWKMGDRYEFRTTWTSGWYLNWLRHQAGVTIPI